jgi:hypothetical protein
MNREPVHRSATAAPARVGDHVVRRHRLLKTRGVVRRSGAETVEGMPRVWVKWEHPDTLPNPSLELVADLEVVRARARKSPEPARGDAAPQR